MVDLPNSCADAAPPQVYQSFSLSLLEFPFHPQYLSVMAKFDMGAGLRSLFFILRLWSGAHLRARNILITITSPIIA
jgi:hypothetical protein